MDTPLQRDQESLAIYDQAMSDLADALPAIDTTDMGYELNQIIDDMIETEARMRGDDDLNAPADDSPQSIWSVARDIVRSHLATSPRRPEPTYRAWSMQGVPEPKSAIELQAEGAE